MLDAKQFWETVKDDASWEVPLTSTLTKREFKEDNWTYVFIFDKGKLFKVEGYNHRELIELYVK